MGGWQLDTPPSPCRRQGVPWPNKLFLPGHMVACFGAPTPFNAKLSNTAIERRTRMRDGADQGAAPGCPCLLTLKGSPGPMNQHLPGQENTLQSLVEPSSSRSLVQDRHSSSGAYKCEGEGGSWRGAADSPAGALARPGPLLSKTQVRPKWFMRNPDGIIVGKSGIFVGNGIMTGAACRDALRTKAPETILVL